MSEPLAELDLIRKVVKYANMKSEIAGKKFKFNMTTNATLLNDDAIDFILEHKISVLVSIDGPKDIHDSQRPFKDGKGSDASVVFGAKKLIDALPPTKSHAVLMNNTKPDLIKDSILNIRFEGVSITPVARSLHKNAGIDKIRDMLVGDDYRVLRTSQSKTFYGFGVERFWGKIYIEYYHHSWLNHGTPYILQVRSNFIEDKYLNSELEANLKNIGFIYDKEMEYIFRMVIKEADLAGSAIEIIKGIMGELDELFGVIKNGK